MINWYRAILRRKLVPPAAGSIAIPTQIVWGGKDKYALLRLAEASRALCRRGNLTIFPSATHWVQHDEVERVNMILLEFLK
jgi:pimeloyl-ACP methyl ester carboxylesterase